MGGHRLRLGENMPGRTPNSEIGLCQRKRPQRLQVLCLLWFNLRWPNTVLARAFADANQHVQKDFKKQTCRQQSDHFIYSTPALSVLFFSIIACSVFVVLVFYYNDMLQKVTMQRAQYFQLLFITERTQLNATHAQLLEKLRAIALAETCRFLAIQSLEFQEIWQKNRSETT